MFIDGTNVDGIFVDQRGCRDLVLGFIAPDFFGCLGMHAIDLVVSCSDIQEVVHHQR